MLDLAETFSETSLGYIKFLDTISSSIKNIPILQDLEDMWKDKVLRSLLMLDLDETHSKASLGYFEYCNTITRSTKNIPVLQDSKKRLGGMLDLDETCS